MSKSSGNTSYSGKKVLVTGGAGFIGSNLCRALVEQGAYVTVIDSLIPEYGGNLCNLKGLTDRVTLNISDVRDPHSMKYLIANQDYLFNLAGQTSHLDSMRDPFPDLEINSRAQLSILEACRYYNPSLKVVFASTRQIYGVPDYLPVDEEHPLRPIDVNGVNKMSGEWFHLVYCKTYGIRSAILRLTNTYGPGMRVKDARQTFLGIWLKNLISGEPISVYGTGEQIRDFNYVDDVVEAFLSVAQSETAWGEVYNLGSREVISLINLATLLVELNEGGSYSVVEFPESLKKIDIGDYYASYEKITKAIQWQPQVSLRQGLSKTLAYYRELGSQYW